MASVTSHPIDPTLCVAVPDKPEEFLRQIEEMLTGIQREDFLAKTLTKRIESALSSGLWLSSVFVRWLCFDRRNDLTKKEADQFTRALGDLGKQDRIQRRPPIIYSKPGIPIALDQARGGMPWHSGMSHLVATSKLYYEHRAQELEWADYNPQSLSSMFVDRQEKAAYRTGLYVSESPGKNTLPPDPKLSKQAVVNAKRAVKKGVMNPTQLSADEAAILAYLRGEK